MVGMGTSCFGCGVWGGGPRRSPAPAWAGAGEGGEARGGAGRGGARACGVEPAGEAGSETATAGVTGAGEAGAAACAGAGAGDGAGAGEGEGLEAEAFAGGACDGSRTAVTASETVPFTSWRWRLPIVLRADRVAMSLATASALMFADLAVTFRGTTAKAASVAGWFAKALRMKSLNAFTIAPVVTLFALMAATFWASSALALVASSSKLICCWKNSTSVVGVKLLPARRIVTTVERYCGMAWTIFLKLSCCVGLLGVVMRWGTPMP